GAAADQVLERVQQLELGLALAAQELHVLEDEQVDRLAMAALELLGALAADRRHQLVRELLGRDVEHALAARARLVRDRDREVRLPAAAAAVQVERAQLELAPVREREARLARERVAFADDEAREVVRGQVGLRRRLAARARRHDARADRGGGHEARRRGGGRGTRARRGRAAQRRVHEQRHGHVYAGDRAGAALDALQIALA